jgi:hypothetical protein
MSLARINETLQTLEYQSRQIAASYEKAQHAFDFGAWGKQNRVTVVLRFRK